MLKKIGILFSTVSLIIAGWALWRTYSIEAKTGESVAAAPVDFTAKVEETLRQKPEMILDAIESLRNKQVKKQQVDAVAAIKEYKDVLVSDSDPQGGNKDGNVTIVEFFDYRCGYCRRAFGEIQQAVKKDGNIKLIYKEFPIFGADSLMTKAALAAQRQGKYEDFHQAIMNSNGKLSLEELETIAEKLNLDVAQWKKDMKDQELDLIVAKNMDLGKKLGIDGTPAFIIGDTLVPGMISGDEIIDLAQKERDKQ